MTTKIIIMFEHPLNFGELRFERILIATDGSKNGEKAAKVGIELAKLSGGKVLIVYVADIGRYMALMSVREVSDKRSEESRLRVQIAASQL